MTVGMRAGWPSSAIMSLADRCVMPLAVAGVASAETSRPASSSKWPSVSTSIATGGWSGCDTWAPPCRADVACMACMAIGSAWTASVGGVGGGSHWAGKWGLPWCSGWAWCCCWNAACCCCCCNAACCCCCCRPCWWSSSAWVVPEAIDKSGPVAAPAPAEPGVAAPAAAAAATADASSSIASPSCSARLFVPAGSLEAWATAGGGWEGHWEGAAGEGGGMA